jgi:probable O-glycosylation ligase (exosortase A-associated)
MRQLLIFSAIILIVPLAFFAPFTGLVSYVAIAYTRPHEWAYMPGAQLSFAVAVATLLGYAIFEFARRAPRFIPNALLLLLWLQLTIATFFAHSQELAQGKLIEFSKTFLMVLLMTAMVDSEKRARWLLLGTALAIGFLAFRSNIWIILTLGQARIHGPGGAFGDNNDYALLLNLAAPMTFYVAQGERNRWIKRLCYALSAMMMVTVLFTQSRGGFLGLCFVLIGLALKSKHKVIGIVTVLLIGSITFALLPDQIIERVGTIRTAREEDKSARLRLEAWDVSWRIVNDYPVFGVGPGNMTEVFNRYVETGHGRVAHNSFLQMAVDGGLPALAAFLGLMLVSWLRLRKSRARLRKSRAPDSPLIAYSHGLEIALLGYFISANFLSRHDLELIYEVYGLATSFSLIARGFEREAEARELSERQARASEPELAAP